MSFVHLFIVKDDKIYRAFVHWRTVQNLVNNGVEFALPLMRSSFVDAGFIVLDCNKNIVVNGQSALNFRNCKKDLFVIEA